MHQIHLIVRFKGQDTAIRTDQDDGRYQDRNDRRQRADHDSCFALPFLQIIVVDMLLQFREDPENALTLQ